MAAGAVALVVAVPIGAVAGLDWEHENGFDYAAAGLGITGLGLLAAGLIEQDLCGYRFSRSRRRADSALRAFSRLSFHPVLRTEKGRFDGLGLRLVEGF